MAKKQKHNITMFSALSACTLFQFLCTLWFECMVCIARLSLKTISLLLWMHNSLYRYQYKQFLKKWAQDLKDAFTLNLPIRPKYEPGIFDVVLLKDCFYSQIHHVKHDTICVAFFLYKKEKNRFIWSSFRTFWFADSQIWNQCRRFCRIASMHVECH